MRKLPKFYFKNGKFCCKTIFNKKDIELYFNGYIIKNLNDPNSFLPKGLHFDDPIRESDVLREFNNFRLLTDYRISNIPNIRNDNGDRIVEFDSHGEKYYSKNKIIKFNMSDKEKCENILYCLYQLREYLRITKECHELETLHNNNKSVPNLEIPRENLMKYNITINNLKEKFNEKNKSNYFLKISLFLSVFINFSILIWML